MMRQTPLIDLLEGRKLFTAVAHASAVATIGDTGGLFAAATTPRVKTPTSPAKLGSARRDLTITVAIDTTQGAVRTTSLYPSAVRLFEVDANGNHLAEVQVGNPQTSGGGDTISVTPDVALKALTRYQFELNQSYVPSYALVKNTSGVNFAPYKFAFTTNTEIAIADPNINFSQQDAGAAAAAYTAVTIGPDGKLYAATMTGDIYRWTIDSDGTLSNSFHITSVLDNNSSSTNAAGNRIITGITFAPDSTAGDLRLWVSHGQYKLGNIASSGTGLDYQADNYSGSISLLSGPNLDTYRDIIVHIPRSVKDHMNNQIVFDPTGANFNFVIPSMSAMGQKDAVWGNRDENVLSAAMFRVNLAKLNNELANSGVIDLDPAANYDVYNPANAMNIYADGIRNAYDMVFHSNGHLYTATNGSSAGGNTPATPFNLSTIPSAKRLDYGTDGAYNGGTVPAASNVQQTEQDLLLDVKQGAYYGHPNPTRGEYVLNAGNTDGNAKNLLEYTTAYPLGTQPDRNYTLPAYDLGKNVSPDGMIEYKSNTFGGRLQGSLLIARYNGGSDILAVKPNSDGTISGSGIQARITGLTGLDAPLDLVENTNNGNLYAVELNEKGLTGDIKLLKPKAIDAKATSDTDNKTKYRVVTYPAPGSRKGATSRLTVTNTGTTKLVIDRSSTRLSGPLRAHFQVVNLGTDDIYVLPGESVDFNVRGVLGRGETAVRANLLLKINQPGIPYLTIQLRASYVPASTAASVGAAVPVILQKNFATNTFAASSVKTDDGWLKALIDAE